VVEQGHGLSPVLLWPRSAAAASRSAGTTSLANLWRVGRWLAMAWAMLPGLMSLTRIECLRWDGNGDRTGGSCLVGAPRSVRASGALHHVSLPESGFSDQCADDLVEVWVPKISSTSSDKAIFVDQATDASLSWDAVLLKVDRFG
jgi:hypothetical protein